MTDSAVTYVLRPLLRVAGSSMLDVRSLEIVDWLTLSRCAASCWVSSVLSARRGISLSYQIMHNNMQIVTYGTMFPTSGKWSNPLTANHLNKSKMLNVVRLYASLYSFRFGCSHPIPFFP